MTLPKYPNLQAEIARLGITVVSLADALGISRQALYNKLRGTTDFTLTELRLIQDYLSKEAGGGFALDYLFKVD